MLAPAPPLHPPPHLGLTVASLLSLLFLSQGSMAFQPAARLFTPAMPTAGPGMALTPIAPNLRAAPRAARLTHAGVRSLASAIADRGWAINDNAPVFTSGSSVQITASTSKPEDWEGDLLFVPMMMAQGEDKKALAPIEGVAAAVDAVTKGNIV
jgi:hypothetical protein